MPLQLCHIVFRDSDVLFNLLSRYRSGCIKTYSLMGLSFSSVVFIRFSTPISEGL